MKQVLYFLYLLAITGLFSCKSIVPQAPSIESVDIPRAKQSISEIDVPISIELKNYFKQAEESVPSDYTGTESVCEGLSYEYFFKRSPFAISGIGNSINLNFDGEYSLDLSYCAKCAFGRCFVPKLIANCGIGEPLRKIKIGYTTTFQLLPDYSLQSKTLLTTLKPIDRCKMTILNLDATDKLIQSIKGPMNTLGEEVDKKIGEYDIKPLVNDLWKKIETEINFGTFGFLSINPQSVHMSGLNINGSVLDFSLTLKASPVLRTYSHKKEPVKLPNLSTYKQGKGFNVNLDLQVSYDTLSKYLSEMVKDQVLLVKKKKIIIKGVKVYGIGNQKIVIGVSFGGRRNGILYLIGKPQYNPATKSLSFPDLAFDIKTKNLVFKMAKWLFSNKVTQAIKDGSQYDFTPILEDIKVNFNKEINRELDKNILSKGKVNSLEILEIYPAANELLLRAVTTGELQIIIKE